MFWLVHILRVPAPNMISVPETVLRIGRLRVWQKQRFWRDFDHKSVQIRIRKLLRICNFAWISEEVSSTGNEREPFGRGLTFTWPVLWIYMTSCGSGFGSHLLWLCEARSCICILLRAELKLKENSYPVAFRLSETIILYSKEGSKRP